jgi:hypothetical protein
MRYMIPLLLAFGCTALAYDKYLMEYGGTHDWKRVKVRMEELTGIGGVSNHIEVLIASAHMNYFRQDYQAANRDLKALDAILRHMAQERLQGEDCSDDEGGG